MKALIAITDSGSGPTMTGQQFETQLFDTLKLPGFGTAAQRNYRFHFISGFAAKTPPGTPWLPTDPVVNNKQCAKVGAAGQGLSILSAGLRFSMCDYQSYGPMFDALAQSEIALTPIECDFPIPTPPAGKTIDPNTIEIVHASGSSSTTLHQVKDLASCTNDAFYVAGSEIHLCPQSCTSVQADAAATLSVTYGCPTSYVPS
jgi:hypothetical protein